MSKVLPRWQPRKKIFWVSKHNSKPTQPSYFATPFFGQTSPNVVDPVFCFFGKNLWKSCGKFNQLVLFLEPYLRTLKSCGYFKDEYSKPRFDECFLVVSCIVSSDFCSLHSPQGTLDTHQAVESHPLTSLGVFLFMCGELWCMSSVFCGFDIYSKSTKRNEIEAFDATTGAKNRFWSAFRWTQTVLVWPWSDHPRPCVHQTFSNYCSVDVCVVVVGWWMLYVYGGHWWWDLIFGGVRICVPKGST
jgi:hypothetical protein